MRPIRVHAIVDTPRERVFDYLLDIANHVEFTDHFLKDFRLERIESRGRGAAARFRVAFPLGSVWAEAVIVSVEPPFRVEMEGRAGRIGRVATSAVYTLTPHDRRMTRVEHVFESDPATRIDRMRELVMRPWLSRQKRMALRRLKRLLEEGQPATHAARVAAG
jgi:uncharacterized protein YndB with AHSA1/START domain